MLYLKVFLSLQISIKLGQQHFAHCFFFFLNDLNEPLEEFSDSFYKKCFIIIIFSLINRYFGDQRWVEKTLPLRNFLLISTESKLVSNELL